MKILQKTKWLEINPTLMKVTDVYSSWLVAQMESQNSEGFP